jgi:hypothetical protein
MHTKSLALRCECKGDAVIRCLGSPSKGHDEPTAAAYIALPHANHTTGHADGHFRKPAFYPLPSIDEPDVLENQIRVAFARDGEFKRVKMSWARLKIPLLTNTA